MSRIVDEKDVPDNVIHLFYTNKDEDHFNNSKINDKTNKLFISKAEDLISNCSRRGYYHP